MHYERVRPLSFRLYLKPLLYENGTMIHSISAFTFFVARRPRRALTFFVVRRPLLRVYHTYFFGSTVLIDNNNNIFRLLSSGGFNVH